MRLILLVAGLALGAQARANEGQDLMMKLSPEKQAYALAHFVRSAGDSCPSGTRAFYQGMVKSGYGKGMAHWNVACSNGKSYVVSLDPDGSTKVLDCGVLKAVAGM